MKSNLEGTMKKTITTLVLLCMTATLLPGETLSEAPSQSFKKAQVDAITAYLHTVKVAAPAPRLSFAERHRKALIWTGFGVGAAVGLVVGLLKHSGNCPSRIFYEGEWYPYKGSYDDQHACPTEPPGISHR